MPDHKRRSGVKHPRLFILIPLGFVLIVGALLLFGVGVQEATDDGVQTVPVVPEE
jgi:hypothetical protein